MYQNIYYDKFNDVIHLWDDTEGYFKFDYQKYAYMEDPNGLLQTIYGTPVSKIYDWDTAHEQSGLLYEYDIRPEIKTLIDVYGGSDDVSVNHNILFFDIEVAKLQKYSTPQEAKNPVVSICCYESLTQNWTLFIHDTKCRLDGYSRDDMKIVKCATEEELLKKFIQYLKDTKPTIMTGWNILGYDCPYLYNRLERVFGKWSGSWLSPIKRVEQYTNRRGEFVFKIAGISLLDYLPLYKTLTTTELPNYNLDAVSMKVLKRGKVQYDGTLDELYETNIDKFIEYNVEDVRLVIDINAKLDFIAIALGVCHKGHVPYDDIYFTSRYMEGACITEAHRRGMVVSTNSREYGEKAAGAFVKSTRAGKYSWVYDLDLKSLYPSNIITLNISPETKYGRIHEWDSYEFVKETPKQYTVEPLVGGKNIELSGNDLREFIKVNNLRVSGNGILYDGGVDGLIPSILNKWSAERDEFRAASNKFHKDGDEEQSHYYDRKQKIQKVLLNSLYGVLLLPSFRFYDRENGEAVTITGQQVIKFTSTMVNHKYNEICGTTGVDYCVYSDTDSVDGDSIVREKHTGDITIKDLFDKYETLRDPSGREFVFPVGCELPYFDEFDNSVKYGFVKYIERHMVTKRRFRITTKSGKSIVVSEDHSIMVKSLKDNTLRKILTCDLKVGDVVISV